MTRMRMLMLSERRSDAAEDIGCMLHYYGVGFVVLGLNCIPMRTFCVGVMGFITAFGGFEMDDAHLEHIS